MALLDWCCCGAKKYEEYGCNNRLILEVNMLNKNEDGKLQIFKRRENMRMRINTDV